MLLLFATEYTQSYSCRIVQIASKMGVMISLPQSYKHCTADQFYGTINFLHLLRSRSSYFVLYIRPNSLWKIASSACQRVDLFCPTDIIQFCWKSLPLRFEAVCYLSCGTGHFSARPQCSTSRPDIGHWRHLEIAAPAPFLISITLLLHIKR